MSIYFQTKPACVQEKTTPIRGTSAAHLKEPLFAFGCIPGNKIVVCNDEGDAVHEIPAASSAPTFLSWHPVKPVFAVGFRNGGFLVSSSDGTMEMREQPSSHQGASISASCFGSYCFSSGTTPTNPSEKENNNNNNAGGATSAAGGGGLGSVASRSSFRASSSGVFAGASSSKQAASSSSSSDPLQQPDLVYFSTNEKGLSAWSISEGTITPSWNTKTASAITTFTPSKNDGFLFAHSPNSSNILVIDEAQQTVNVGATLEPEKEVGRPVRSVFESVGKHGARYLIVLTSTAYLLTFKCGFDGKLTELTRRKLNASVVSDVNLFQLVSVAPGIVAVAAGDATIRVIAYDELSGRTHPLYFPEQVAGGGGVQNGPSSTAGASSSSSQVVVSLSSSRQKLCAGNRAGNIAVWQFHGEGFLPSAQVASSISNTAAGHHHHLGASSSSLLSGSTKAQKEDETNNHDDDGENQPSLDEFQLLSLTSSHSTHASTSAATGGTGTSESTTTTTTTAKSGAGAGAIEKVVMSSSANGTVLVCGIEFIHLLQGAVRQRKWHQRAMVLQISPYEAVAQTTAGVGFYLTSVSSSTSSSSSSGTATSTSGGSGFNSGTNTSNHQKDRIRGVDIFLPNVMLWTGKHAEVFNLVENSGTAALTNTFEQTLPACALYADGLLLTKPDKLIMQTFSKHTNYTLSVSEAEGTPQVVHVAEEIGAMVTNKGSLRVFRIGQRDLKMIGPSRSLRIPASSSSSSSPVSSSSSSSSFGADGGESPTATVTTTLVPARNINLMAINRSGKKVAFTCGGGGGSSSSSAGSGELTKMSNSNVDVSTSVFVYDVETDSCFEYPFGDKTPMFLSWNMTMFNQQSASSPSTLQSSSSSSAAAGSSSSTGFNSFNAAISGSGQQGNPDSESQLLSIETRVTKFSSHSSSSSSSGKHGGLIDASQNASGFLNQAGGGGSGGKVSSSSDRHVVTLFSSPKGVFFHHTIPLQQQHSGLIGCSVPHIVIGLQLESDPFDDDEELSPAAKSTGYEYSLFLKHLRDFEGMHQQAEQDAKLREALMNFAYFAAIGNMDEAYKAVKLVKDPAIWVNMAKMCVTTKRLDVAEVCLSNMQDTVAARAVREAREKEEQIEVRLATLAMALGMTQEAENLLKKCKRFDMLTELMIACGRWDGAVQNCEQHDRLRTTSVFFRQAQQAENAGHLDAALQLYGRAKCLGTESPRLFFASNRIDELREKVKTTDDRDLLIWWAQFLESSQDVNGALECYKRANDGFNVIRLLVTQLNQVGEAEDILSRGLPVNSATSSSSASGDSVAVAPAGAAFFIAQYYEKQSSASSTAPPEQKKLLHKAVQMYEKASAYENAIRIGKEHDMHVEVLRISLKCGNHHTALESARYFEEKQMFEKAVQLYRHGGDNSRAIDVCIRGGLFDELHRISESLEQGADPETFISMASHFNQSGHYSKAVEMLVFGKAFNEALQLCLDKNVTLTDAMAEAMILPKSENAEDEEYRINLLKKIAKVAKDQESYHLSCKAYTLAGEVMKAMRVLLRSGDTEKIIFFANHIRDQEVYRETANFLQSVDWQHNAVIFKSIVSLYTKGKAFDSLARFYDSAATVQIDENLSYEKAAGLLREGQKALDKAGDSVQSRQRDALKSRIGAIDSLLKAMSLAKQGSSSDFVGICEDLLNRARPPHPDSEIVRSAVRIGDISALLVQHYGSVTKEYQKALSVLQSMHKDGIQPALFVEPSLLQQILHETNQPPNVFDEQNNHNLYARKPSFGAAGAGTSGGGMNASSNEIVREDIAEDLNEDI